jgi:hypothetical protein
MFGGEQGGGRAGWEREEIFHTDFEGPRQAKGDRSIRHIAAGFDGVDGLAADAGALGEIGCRETALLAVDRQVVGDGAVVLHARRWDSFTLQQIGGCLLGCMHGELKFAAAR